MNSIPDSFAHNFTTLELTPNSNLISNADTPRTRSP